LGVWELAFVMFDGLFLEFLTPSTLEGCTFFNFIPFFMIFITLNAPIGGLQILFKHKNMEPSP
jgi:hypothetical protein